jgi:hypothetical protein
MKTTFFYGLIIAIANILLNYVMYFLGFHDSVEKFPTGQMIVGIAGLVIGVVGLVLAIRARRAETPATEGFGYGRSLFAGVLTAFWCTCFTMFSWVIYLAFVNPGVREIMVQSELAKLEAKGLSSTQIEQAEGMIRMMMGPVPQALIGFCFSLIIWTLIALIVAAFIRRPAPAAA